MRRPSRIESQAKTRNKLLAVAKAAFLRSGYEATSVEQIAETAGYSKGAVYSNFESKDQLCLAVIDAIRAERAATLSKAIADVKTLEERLAALQRWAERNVGDRSWTVLEVEFGVHAARNPELARALMERGKALRARIAALVDAFAVELGAELPLPAGEVAVALLSLGIGLGLQRAVDPNLPVRVLSDLLRFFAGNLRRRT